MLSKKIQEAFNAQINAELYSAYLYLSMAAYFKDQGLEGFATWMQAQALEEQVHAMKFFTFVAERGGRVLLQAIAGPPTEWRAALDCFQEVLAHERKVSGLINDLVNLAIKEKDHASNNFLQWFISEQVEEEASATDVINKLKLIDANTGGMFMLDKELGARTFLLPPGTTIVGGVAAA